MHTRTKMPKIEIGVLFSTSGPYSAVGVEMLAGALMGIEEVNRSGEFEFQLTPTIRDPGGDAVSYATLGREILSLGAVKHVIGCYTSWSRKEIIPVIEKYDALLWYPSHYEGFESCANTIYTGASPNQHIVPLARYMIQNHGANAYCCGSNYVWPWENNRVMRAMLNAAGGDVLAEKYLPIGSTDVDGFIDDIRQMKPDFIFNTLIGESSYAFFRKYHEVGLSDPTFRPETTPIVSCSLSEPELLQIGGLAAVGHIASSVYFETIDSQVNRSFIQRYRNRFGPGRVTSADAEASYNSVTLLAQAIHRAGSAEIDAVRGALSAITLDAPQGPIWVDPDNNHCYLTPRLARSAKNASFDILETESAPVKPDPYLLSLRQPVANDPLDLSTGFKSTSLPMSWQ